MRLSYLTLWFFNILIFRMRLIIIPITKDDCDTQIEMGCNMFKHSVVRH